MNLNITGVHLDVTPALRTHIESKLARVFRHTDSITSAHIIVSTEKNQHKAEANVHVTGKDLHAEAIEADMYAAIDVLADKLDRVVLKHKEKQAEHR